MPPDPTGPNTPPEGEQGPHSAASDPHGVLANLRSTIHAGRQVQDQLGAALDEQAAALAEYDQTPGSTATRQRLAAAARALVGAMAQAQEFVGLEQQLEPRYLAVPHTRPAWRARGHWLVLDRWEGEPPGRVLGRESYSEAAAKELAEQLEQARLAEAAGA